MNIDLTELASNVTPLNVCLTLLIASIAMGRWLNSCRFYLLAAWYAVQTGLELIP